MAKCKDQNQGGAWCSSTVRLRKNWTCLASGEKAGEVGTWPLLAPSQKPDFTQPIPLLRKTTHTSEGLSENREYVTQTPCLMSRPLQPDPSLLCQAHLHTRTQTAATPSAPSWLCAFAPLPLSEISPPTIVFACQ